MIKGAIGSYVSYIKVFTDGGDDIKNKGKNMKLMVIIVIDSVLVKMNLIIGYWHFNIHHNPILFLANHNLVSLNFVAMSDIAFAVFGMLSTPASDLVIESMSKGSFITSLHVIHVEAGSLANLLTTLKAIESKQNLIVIALSLVSVGRVGGDLWLNNILLLVIFCACLASQYIKVILLSLETFILLHIYIHGHDLEDKVNFNGGGNVMIQMEGKPCHQSEVTKIVRDRTCVT